MICVSSRQALPFGATNQVQLIRSERVQNEKSPNFSNFRPEFRSEFSPTFQDFACLKQRPQKIHQKSPPFFQCQIPSPNPTMKNLNEKQNMTMNNMEQDADENQPRETMNARTARVYDGGIMNHESNNIQNASNTHNHNHSRRQQMIRRTVLGSSRAPCYQRDLCQFSVIFC